MNSLKPKIKKYILIFISFLAIFGLWMLLSYDKTEPKPKFKEEFAERPASKIDVIREQSKGMVQFDVALSLTNLSEQFDKEGYNMNLWYNKLTPSLEKHTNIPTGLNISQDYPELVHKLNEGKIKVFVRQGDNSYEEWFNLIMHWFAPVGQDRLALSITDKDTGEVTTINSYQDYLAWRESHPKDSEVQGSE